MDNIIWVILALILIAIVAYFYWQRQVNVPRITHVVFPPYDVPDVILVGGLLVENRGRASALNVRIDIQYEHADTGRIQHMHVTSDDPYVLRGGGEQHNFANIRLRELRPHKRVFVFWSAGEQFQPSITVISSPPQGAGANGRSPLLARPRQALTTLLQRGRKMD